MADTVLIPDARLLADFRGDAAELPESAFIEKHGPGFLLLSTSDSLKASTRTARTVYAERSNTGESPAPQLSFIVLSIRPRGEEKFPGFVSLGRTDNNDIRVNDESISKFHAFFRRDDDTVTIQDAGSKNGTFVNDERAAARGTGDPVLLHSGARLKLGSVEMTFLLTPELIALVKRLSG